MKYDVKVNKLPHSEVEVEISLDTSLLPPAQKKAIQMFSDSLELPGFRKGHIPENIVIEKVGESRILEEAADILLKEHFPKIIEQEKIDMIGKPEIRVTKLAPGNPLEFKAKLTTMPVFEIGDYKKIAKTAIANFQEEKIEVTEKEVADVLLQIRKNKAHFDYHKNNPNDHDHSHQNLDLEKEENLPPLDDNLAKAAGNFKNLEELKDKIRENILSEKKYRNIEKKRALIMEKLIEEVKIEVPRILIESEINKSLAQMKDDVVRMGGKWEDYLEHIKKKEEDLRKDLEKSSEEKAKIQLIFNKIAVAEKIEPNKEVLEQEVQHLMEHYKDASRESARIYVATILSNQEVLKLLENQ